MLRYLFLYFKISYVFLNNTNSSPLLLKNNFQYIRFLYSSFFYYISSNLSFFLSFYFLYSSQLLPLFRSFSSFSIFLSLSFLYLFISLILSISLIQATLIKLLKSYTPITPYNTLKACYFSYKKYSVTIQTRATKIINSIFLNKKNVFIGFKKILVYKIFYLLLFQDLVCNKKLKVRNSTPPAHTNL